MTRYHFTRRSENKKLGPIPAIMSSMDSCPPACNIKKQCYASNGPISISWRKLSIDSRRKDGTPFGMDPNGLLQCIRELPEGQLFRFNTAGDLTGANNSIDSKFLNALVDANRGKRGFTYTHKPMTAVNQRLVRKANDNGFTINLSADSPAQADYLKTLNVGPVVTILPETVRSNFRTDAGHLVVVCPAVTHSDVTCASCKLCAWKDRDVIVGFPAHGIYRKLMQPTMPKAFQILQ